MTTVGSDGGETGMWATFYLSGEVFALRVEDVQEVLMPQPLTPVPLAPPHVVGLLNLRGQIMPAIDLRRRLHFPVRTEQGSGSILVLKLRDDLVSVVVDQIGDVLSLPTRGWKPPPDTLHARHLRAVFGICPIDEHVVLGLRAEALCSSDEDGHEPTKRQSTTQ